MDSIEDDQIKIFLRMKQNLNDMNIILNEFKNNISFLKEKSYFDRTSYTIDEELKDLEVSINNKLKYICDHEWVTDYVDNGAFDVGIKITYCCKCEINKS